MKIKLETKRLLERIKRQIKKEPKQFIMDAYFWSSYRIPNCGTAACIAGWAVTFGNNFENPKVACEIFQGYGEDGGRIALGISRRQAVALFNESEWPERFQGSRNTLAKRAVKRINHFIKTGE